MLSFGTSSQELHLREPHEIHVKEGPREFHVKGSVKYEAVVRVEIER